MYFRQSTTLARLHLKYCIVFMLALASLLCAGAAALPVTTPELSWMSRSGLVQRDQSLVALVTYKRCFPTGWAPDSEIIKEEIEKKLSNQVTRSLFLQPKHSPVFNKGDAAFSVFYFNGKKVFEVEGVLEKKPDETGHTVQLPEMGDSTRIERLAPEVHDQLISQKQMLKPTIVNSESNSPGSPAKAK
ncbi:hypothetical protein J3R30DRAFT_3679917 [Lentinula aciculospora]|uniref:Chalcone isomerase domain-containing protein n=1 Tax=Lentinula aciculospora TaxID=153920 RepID=A0A9W9APF0_9AGAR|nr:hypothetical protein J3R30DRAFT_3679917 [Lentinula aciculospora]